MSESAVSAATLSECARYLREHENATWIDLIELGFMSSEALLAPERILSRPVNADRLDLVAEFRERPLGPHEVEVREMLWLLRSQTPAGRYVLRRAGGGRWEVLRLVGKRRPRWELVQGGEFQTLEDAEWAVFTFRWRDQTGRQLSLKRSEP